MFVIFLSLSVSRLYRTCVLLLSRVDVCQCDWSTFILFFFSFNSTIISFIVVFHIQKTPQLTFRSSFSHQMRHTFAESDSRQHPDSVSIDKG